MSHQLSTYLHKKSVLIYGDRCSMLMMLLHAILHASIMQNLKFQTHKYILLPPTHLIFDLVTPCDNAQRGMNFTRSFGMTNVFSHPRDELHTAEGMKVILAQFIP